MDKYRKGVQSPKERPSVQTLRSRSVSAIIGSTPDPPSDPVITRMESTELVSWLMV